MPQTADRAPEELYGWLAPVEIPAYLELARLRALVANLEKALESRETIGMAKGILMARERCGPDEAFDMLRRASQRENRRLAELAKWIVDENSKPQR